VKYNFYEQDAKQWAEWGVDYLKFHWKIDSSFRVENMRNALDNTGREFILEISNDGKIGDAPIMTSLANMTRTTDDIIDVWETHQLDSHIRKWAMNVRDIWTLFEISRAEEFGAEIVKLFPGQESGPAFVKALKAPLPHSSIMATGGVSPEAENLREWFDSDVTCVGIGGKLFPKTLVQGGDFSSLTSTLSELLRFVKTLGH
jgi:hypothetical protein